MEVLISVIPGTETFVLTYSNQIRMFDMDSLQKEKILSVDVDIIIEHMEVGYAEKDSPAYY